MSLITDVTRMVKHHNISRHKIRHFVAAHKEMNDATTVALMIMEKYGKVGKYKIESRIDTINSNLNSAWKLYPNK